MSSDRHRTALAQTRRRLLRDTLLFAGLPVVACWALWLILGQGFIWPIIPTLIAVAWAGAVWGRWREVFIKNPPKTLTKEDIRQDVTEVPRIRFDEDGDPTESFIQELRKQELHKRDKDS